MAPRNIRIVDLRAVRKNLKLIRGSVPASVRIMAVVKADAYGHGARECAKAVLESGADALAVASVKEGAELRDGDIGAPILVLGAVTQEDVLQGVEAGLVQTVCTPEMVLLCAEAARLTHRDAMVHLKIDTGMGRIGIKTMEERDAVLQALRESAGVRLTGAFTHFADADGDEEGMRYTKRQYQRFIEITEGLRKDITLHCCNSAALHRFPWMGLSMVRAGISLYGYPPVRTELPLQPCMSWYAKVSHVKEIDSGESVSYGRTWTAPGKRRIATITCGYADGYHRAASGSAEVLIRGSRFPIVGRICMDQMMADITGHEEIQPEDKVVLMGKSGAEKIDANDLARWSGTIPYETLLSAGSRVERCFLDEEETE